MGSFLSAVKGIQLGLYSSEYKRMENSVRAGRDNFGTATLQFVQGITALEYISKAYKEANRPGLSLVSKGVVCLAPALIAILKNSRIASQKAKRALSFFQDNISHLYQVAAVASSISLLFFGHSFFAVSSLAMLGIGFLDRNGLMPQKCRKFLHKYNQPFFIATGLVTGGVLDKLISGYCVFSWCVSALLSYKKNQGNGFTFQQNLTPEKAQAFLDEQWEPKVKINREYVKYFPLPPIPDIDIRNLLVKFQNIDWSRNLNVLRQKLKSDARFTEKHGNPDNISDQEVIAYAENNLNKLIEDIKNERILDGEPADYLKLHNYLKLIAQYVDKQEDAIEVTDIILRLAIEGGMYCGPGKFEVAESVFLQTVGANPEMPFNDKIAYCLEHGRHEFFDSFYNFIVQFYTHSIVSKVMDFQDVHNRNHILNLLGDELGLRKASADNDDRARIDPFTLLITAFASRKIKDVFWQKYDLKKHTDILISAIGSAHFEIQDIYLFWRDWIDRQNIDDSQKQDLLDELTIHQTLFGKPLEENGKITPQFVSLMLIDMGIAQIE